MTDLIQINFEQFHRDNPGVFILWDRFTREAIAMGLEHGSAGLVAERIRWETSIVTRGEPVKINNNYRSRYARLWEQENPEYRGFFRKRSLAEDSLDSVEGVAA